VRNQKSLRACDAAKLSQCWQHLTLSSIWTVGVGQSIPLDLQRALLHSLLVFLFGSAQEIQEQAWWLGIRMSSTDDDAVHAHQRWPVARAESSGLPTRYLHRLIRAASILLRPRSLWLLLLHCRYQDHWIRETLVSPTPHWKTGWPHCFFDSCSAACVCFRVEPSLHRLRLDCSSMRLSS